MGAEGRGGREHDPGKALYKIVQRVEGLPYGERDADSGWLERDFRPLHDADRAIECARGGKGRERAREHGVDARRAFVMQNRRECGRDREGDQGGSSDGPQLSGRHGQHPGRSVGARPISE